MKVQNLEDFRDDDGTIEYPHFYMKGSMDKQWDYLTEEVAADKLTFWQKYIWRKKKKLDPKGAFLKKELLDLPLINFLDPNSIRSVGAFFKCVF